MRHMLDPIRLYADKLQTVSLPGESVVALAGVTYVPGNETMAPPSHTVDFDPLNGLHVSRWNEAAERGIVGSTLHGARGSLAASLRERVDAMCDLAVTSQRLLVLDSLAGTDPVRVVWECPLGAVAELRHDPKWNQQGRLLVGFRDGSAVRLVAGFFLGGKAKRLSTAFASAARR